MHKINQLQATPLDFKRYDNNIKRNEGQSVTYFEVYINRNHRWKKCPTVEPDSTQEGP